MENYRHVSTRLSIKDVFPNETVFRREDMLRFRLGKFGLTETLLCCAYLNYRVSSHEQPLTDLKSQRPLIGLFLPEEKVARILPIASPTRVKNVYKFVPTFFDRHQMLALMRMAILHCSERGHHPMQTSASKKQFVMSALLAGELIDASLWPHLEEKKELDEKALLEPVRESARLATPAKNFILEFVRGFQLFDYYLPIQIPNFKQQFEGHTGLSIQEYYGCLFITASPSMGFFNGNRNPNTLIFPREIYCQDERICKIMNRYLEQEAYTADRFKEAIEQNTHYHPFKPFRERPILLLADGGTLVLDPFFHTEKASFGPLFAVSSKVKDLMDAFGRAFESYVQDILVWIAANSRIDSRNCLFNQKLGSHPRPLGELDAVIIDDPALLLFEIKAKWVKDNQRISPDYSEYLSDLGEKYGKGARQLARVLTNLTDDDSVAKIQGHDIAKTVNVFPVMVPLDSSLTLPGYTQYFEREFSDSLCKSGKFHQENKRFTRGQWTVHPLAVMTVDVLETLEGATTDFSLTQFLQDYADHRNRSPHKQEDTSMADFLVCSTYQSSLRTPEQTRSRALLYLKEVFSAIVPKQISEELLGETR